MVAWWVVVLLVLVGTGGGVALGRWIWRVPPEDLVEDDDTPGLARVATAATVVALDSLAAAGIRQLSSWLLPGSSGGTRIRPAADGTLALVFGDIVGSTALNVELGDADFAALLATHDRHLRALVRDSSGHVVKTQGDGFLAVFADPVDAVGMGLQLVDDLADGRHGRPLRLRVGIHLGQAVTARDDVFGTNVAFAARVAAEASPGEVLVSRAVRERIEGGSADVAFSARLLPVRLKGIPGLHRLVRVQAVSR